MEHDAPGLFEIDTTPPARCEPSQRGRSRETWTCTTTAAVTIRDRVAVDRAFRDLEHSAYLVEEVTDPGPENARGLRPLDQLAWLVWPTTGLDRAQETDAFRILSVGTEVLDDQGDEGVLAWTVTVKLRNVQELRRLAVEQCLGDADLIADSFAVAWERAIDPFAPLRSVPGIVWEPGTVDISLVPARSGHIH